jgi:hypothetical protein
MLIFVSITFAISNLQLSLGHVFILISNKTNIMTKIK